MDFTCNEHAKITHTHVKLQKVTEQATQRTQMKVLHVDIKI